TDRWGRPTPAPTWEEANGDRHREPGHRRDGQDVRRALRRGGRRQARPGGRGLPPLPANDVGERAEGMRAAADILDREVDAVAATMTTEMGKTLKAARAEAQKCAKACRFYAEHAEGFLADEPVDPSAVGASRAFARYLPIGVVLAVMPWNFPLWQAMRFAAPALMAGNVGLLKH